MLVESWSATLLCGTPIYYNIFMCIYRTILINVYGPWKVNILINQGKSILPLEVLGVFQFEPQSFKISNVPPNVSKKFNLNLMLLIFVKLDENL
jgi:hypothetical protein